jgi:hypothetical protein
MPYKNINPAIWGPNLWKFMHYLTLSYPENPTEEEKDRLFDFFENIQTLLPCEKCRYNFKNHLEKTPLSDDVLSTNISVVTWLFNLHNEVNKSLDKPELSYADFIDIYSVSSTKTNNNVTLKEIEKNIDKQINNGSCGCTGDAFKKEIKSQTNKNKIIEKSLFEKIKENTLLLGFIIIIILAIMIYLNKYY